MRHLELGDVCELSIDGIARPNHMRKGIIVHIRGSGLQQQLLPALRAVSCCFNFSKTMLWARSPLGSRPV